MGTKSSMIMLTPPPPACPPAHPPDFPTAQDLFFFLDRVIDDTAAVSSESELLHDFGMTPDELIEVMEKELQGTHIEEGDSAMEVVDPPVSGDRWRHAMRKIDMSGNEWLRELMTGQGCVTIHDLYQSSMAPRMRSFWVGDLATGSDHCVGGLMCLAHVAFQQTNDARLNNTRISSFDESKWQFLYLVLHHMTTDKQQRLVSFLVGAPFLT